MAKILLATLPRFGLDDDERLHAKRVDEEWVLGFDFAPRMSSGETLDAATWTSAVHAGADADAADMIDGSSTESGTTSAQKVVAGVDGVTYLIKCVATTSAQVLIGEALLFVSDQVRSDGTVR